MTYKHNVMVDGEWVDLKDLPKEKQEEISKELTERLANTVAVGQARQQAV
jgi:hypothetical protein